jgi:hypothetical protein
MTTLMTYSGEVAPDSGGTRTGGLPLVHDDFAWPDCATCEGPMQFLAQLRLDGRDVLHVFMCQNDPGLCDEWDPTAGGNRAFVLPANGVAATPPPNGETQLGAVSGVEIVYTEDRDYNEARENWGRQRDVLGQFGGVPSWIQADETPDCAECGDPMKFVAQLEEGHDHRTAANFGGGCAYAFRCEACRTATFLWQC